MKKLFTVTKDMNTMSHDQLKGAVYNMEETANAMYVALHEMFKEHAGHPDKWTVLSFDPDSFSPGVKNIYLPSIDGRDVIIPMDRRDSLMNWKLRFFAKYGNLVLDVQFKGDDLNVAITLADNVTEPLAKQFVSDRLERSRSDAALYESMRNVKRH